MALEELFDSLLYCISNSNYSKIYTSIIYLFFLIKRLTQLICVPITFQMISVNTDIRFQTVRFYQVYLVAITPIKIAVSYKPTKTVDEVIEHYMLTPSS